MVFLDQGSDWNVSQDCSKQARRQILSNSCLTYATWGSFTVHLQSHWTALTLHLGASKQVKVIPTTNTQFKYLPKQLTVLLASWLCAGELVQPILGCVLGQQCCWSPLGPICRCNAHLSQVLRQLYVPLVQGRWRVLTDDRKGQENTPTELRWDQVKCLCFSFPKGSTCPAFIVAVS